MQSAARRVAAVAALLGVAACSESPTRSQSDDLLVLADLDPAIGAEPGQAGALGITLDPAITYDGSLGISGACTWSAASQRLVCPPVTRGSLTIMRSIAFHDAAGTAQQRRDQNTRAANTRIDVRGTMPVPRGSVVVNRSSDLTVSGLGVGATTHTLNGLESGSVIGSISTDRGSATINEASSSRTQNVVVPVSADRGRWPLSGTTTRTGQVAITRAGTRETRTSSWSETITWNGTASVSVTITRDGTTRTCTRDLVTRDAGCR